MKTEQLPIGKLFPDLDLEARTFSVIAETPEAFTQKEIESLMATLRRHLIRVANEIYPLVPPEEILKVQIYFKEVERWMKIFNNRLEFFKQQQAN